MSDPNLLFNMRLNKARHDRDFQFFLALCGFGQHMLAQDGTYGVIVSEWRSITYVLKELTGLPARAPGLYPISLNPGN